MQNSNESFNTAAFSDPFQPKFEILPDGTSEAGTFFPGLLERADVAERIAAAIMTCLDGEGPNNARTRKWEAAALSAEQLDDFWLERLEIYRHGLKNGVPNALKAQSMLYYQPSVAGNVISTEQLLVNFRVATPQYVIMNYTALKKNIVGNVKLLEEYQYILTFTSDPKERARINLNIEHLEEQLKKMEADLAVLEKQWVDK